MRQAQTKQNHYFVAGTGEGTAAAWKVGGTACRLLFARSPTQQNDRGFVALGWNRELVGNIPVCCEADQRRGVAPPFLIEYQVQQNLPGNPVDILGNVNR